ncbi:Protein argonaute [Elsinoe australis]|uniref:Protein argonaute n=1 Tax=Elsinoe australis TaxID=40998 RepID=A0A2P7Z3D2_9PEZI|nr:Protein argonaute [Elsinoe australis]
MPPKGPPAGQGGGRGRGGQGGGPRGGRGGQGGGGRGGQGGGYQGGQGDGYRGGQGGQGGGYQGGGRGGYGGRGGRGDLPYHPAGDRGGRGGPPRGRAPVHTTDPAYAQRDISRARSMNTDTTSHHPHSVQDGFPRLFQPGGAEEVVDKTAQAYENAIVKRKPRPDALLPARTGFGGEKDRFQSEVYANYLRISLKAENSKDEDRPLHKYSVATKEQLAKGKMRALVRKILLEPPFANVHAATDFYGIIVTNKKLDLPNDTWRSEVDLRDADEIARSPENTRIQAFELKWQDTYELAPMVAWLRGQQGGITKRDEILQVMNIIFGYHAAHGRIHVHQIGPTNKFFYDSYVNQNAFDIGGGLRALRGYIASVRPSGGRLLLNLNVVTGAFYKLMPLRQVAWALLRGDRAAYAPRTLSRDEMKKLENMLKLVRIECHYMPMLDAQGKPMREGGKEIRKKVVRNICGFNPPDYKTAKQQRFEVRDQTTGQTRSVTVFDYFREKYPNSGYEEDHGWPVVNVGTRDKPTWVPLQLCMMAPAQAVRRMLSGDQTSNMITFAARAPHANAEKIVTEGTAMFKLTVAGQASSHNNFGIGINPSLIKVPARFFQPPRLAYGGQKPSPNIVMSGWNLSTVKFNRGVTIDRAALVQMVTFQQRGKQMDPQHTIAPQTIPLIIGEIKRHFRKYDLVINNMLSLECLVPAGGTFVNKADYQKAIEATMRQLAENKISIAIWILEERDTFTYSYIKKMGDVKCGVQTVCTVAKKLFTAYNKRGFKPDDPGDSGFYGNLALKVNIKGSGLRGVNHFVNANELSGDVAKIWDAKTMFIGIDVTHPSPGSSKATPSIAAVVANTDRFLAQWPGSLGRQTVSRKEIVDYLQAMVVDRLRLWQVHNNKTLPTRIIVYRDGVSEGQFEQVIQYERPGIQGAIAQVYGNLPKPKLAIITVTKRHHTRFYPAKAEDMDTKGKSGGTTGNCKPGLVVDRGVSDAELYDFFLQPHFGLQGTVKPARYVVLHDELNMGADGLQKMTHTLCYLFNRATRAVSLCPPAYYADLLCERARCYLHETYTGANFAATEETDDGGVSEWNGLLHPNIKDTTFYI